MSIKRVGVGLQNKSFKYTVMIAKKGHVKYVRAGVSQSCPGEMLTKRE